MARLSLLLSFLALAASALANNEPQQQALAGEFDTPVHTSDSWAWESCGLESDVIQIDSIQVSPDPPKPGKNLTVTVTASASERVEEGAYADVTVKLGLIKLLQKSFDLCEEARKANATIQCPIEEGKYTVVQTVELPKEIPQAKFRVSAVGYTVDDDNLFCVDLVVDFMKKPFFKIFGQ
ncbi:hypothetical protein DENSPDRAFT_793937 [Dentipellis sp. KUC8613]|nr:hypothetical protein DENSPDRAFT_793937 [Dentipellis sp. KUC8613]